MIFHAVDLACTNSWLEYKKDAENAKINKNVLDSLHFKIHIAESLIKVGKPCNLKRKAGRPSKENLCDSPQSSKRKSGECMPLRELQLDMFDHMPEYDEMKEATRCKN